MLLTFHRGIIILKLVLPCLQLSLSAFGKIMQEDIHCYTNILRIIMQRFQER